MALVAVAAAAVGVDLDVVAGVADAGGVVAGAAGVESYCLLLAAIPLDLVRAQVLLLRYLLRTKDGDNQTSSGGHYFCIVSVNRRESSDQSERASVAGSKGENGCCDRDGAAEGGAIHKTDQQDQTTKAATGSSSHWQRGV